MWKVSVKVDGFGKVNYPSICPLTPVRGKAFCSSHIETAKKANIESDLKKFLQKCDSESINMEGEAGGNYKKLL